MPVVYMFILLTSAEELYIAYNNISDLSQLTWLDHLEVLDLEGNNIEDINQVQYLRLCCKLSHLTVEGNLICLKPNAESAEVRTWFAHIVFFFCQYFLTVSWKWETFLHLPIASFSMMVWDAFPTFNFCWFCGLISMVSRMTTSEIQDC